MASSAPSAFHNNTDDLTLLSEVAATQLAVELENTRRKCDELERTLTRTAVPLSTDRGQQHSLGERRCSSRIDAVVDTSAFMEFLGLREVVNPAQPTQNVGYNPLAQVWIPDQSHEEKGDNILAS
jgi:hypothetical protein